MMNHNLCVQDNGEHGQLYPDPAPATTKQVRVEIQPQAKELDPVTAAQQDNSKLKDI